MKTIIIAIKKSNKITKRFMFKGGPGTWGKKLFRFPDKSQRDYRFRVTTYKEGVKKPDGSPLDKHEIKHYSVYDSETGELIGLLTSSKSDSIKLEPIKFNGSFIKEEDENGNIIPSSLKGGQYFRVYGTIRVVSNNEIRVYEEGKIYLEKHEAIIIEEMEKHDVANKPREWRVLQENVNDDNITSD